MNITFVCQRYHPYHGGVETHIKEVSERLVRKGHNIEVLTTDPSGKLEHTAVINGVSVKRFRSFAPKHAYYFPEPAMYRAIKRCSSDIVHAHTIQAFPLFAAAIAKSEDVRWRFIMTPHYHGPATTTRNILFSLYMPLLKNIMGKADKVISVSMFEKRLLINEFNVDPKRIVTIPNGLDLEEIKKVKREPDPDTFNILFVGRLESYKNPDKVIEATKLLYERNIKNIRTTIIGDGEERERLISLVNQLNLQDRVVMKSNITRKELLEEYSRATIFVLPSLHEAYGISAVEAIAMGIPTIVANATALSDLVEQKAAVGIEPPVTAEKLSRAILDLYNNPQHNPHTIEIIDWDTVVERLLEVYYNTEYIHVT